MKPWHATPLVLLALRALAGPPAVDPSDSVYQLKASLTAQDGREIGLDVYRGQPVLVTMFYASCQATCPLIIDTLRSVERKLDAGQLKKRLAEEYGIFIRYFNKPGLSDHIRISVGKPQDTDSLLAALRSESSVS